LDDLSRIEGGIAWRLESQHLVAFYRRLAGRAQRQAQGTVRRQPAATRNAASRRIDDDPGRIFTITEADRELRVVGHQGAGPDQHRIDAGAQPVQVGQSGLAIDIFGFAAGGRDAAVKRLADLA